MGPLHGSYFGKAPFKDTLKFGLAFTGCISLVLIVRESAEWYFWQKREDYKRRPPESSAPKEAGNAITEDQPPRKATCRPSSELFNRSKVDDSNWIVDGYMKVGLVNLLVAGGGVGKSILLVQIALSADLGKRPLFLPQSSRSSFKLNVVFYRMEDFSGELEGKYGGGKVLRDSHINWVLPQDLPEFSLDGFLMHLDVLSEGLKADTLVCVDPATKLPGYKHTDFINGVEAAQKKAKAKGCTLTIVASVHLDEIKDWTPLTNCDIKGGDKGLQLAGSVTALRKERTGGDYRYIQCLKEPKGSPKPYDGKVVVMKKEQLSIDEKNWNVHFKYDSIKFESEARPLKPKTQSESDSAGSPTSSAAPQKSAPNQKVTPEMEQKIKDMLGKGMKSGVIARKLQLSRRTICRYRKQFEQKAN